MDRCKGRWGTVDLWDRRGEVWWQVEDHGSPTPPPTHHPPAPLHLDHLGPVKELSSVALEREGEEEVVAVDW